MIPLQYGRSALRSDRPKQTGINGLRCRRAGARKLAVGRRAIERGRADLEAAAGPAQHLIDPQGASLLDDESEVMGQMLDRTVDHLAHRPIAPIANDSRPLPRLRW